MDMYESKVLDEMLKQTRIHVWCLMKCLGF